MIFLLLLLSSGLHSGTARADCEAFKYEGREVTINVTKVSRPVCHCISKAFHPASVRLTGPCVVEGKLSAADGKTMDLSLLPKGGKLTTAESKICGSLPGKKFKVKLRALCRDEVVEYRKDRLCTDSGIMKSCEYNFTPSVYLDLIR